MYCSSDTLDGDIDLRIHNSSGDVVCNSSTYDSSWEACDIAVTAGQTITLSTGQTILLAVSLAFLFGYALSSLPLLGAGMRLGQALRLVLAADTLSIIVMEVVDNAVMASVPGAMDSGLVDPVFWLAMIVALSTAFLAAFPVNLKGLSRFQTDREAKEVLAGVAGGPAGFGGGDRCGQGQRGREWSGDGAGQDRDRGVDGRAVRRPAPPGHDGPAHPPATVRQIVERCTRYPFARAYGAWTHRAIGRSTVMR